jgi:hypothetical protein
MSLLKEFTAKGDYQADLKTSDGSDMGSTDTTAKPVDVRFSLMRNMINKDGAVSGSDVNDYLERAEDLNDEVDSVGYALETDGGEMIKIYVNAAEADEFENELSNLLGLDGDTEAAINTLAQKFDIVDVVWPDDPEPEEVDGEDDLSLDDISALGMDSDNADSTNDSADPEMADNETDPADEMADEVDATDDDVAEPELDKDGKPKLDKDGNVIFKKKKKAVTAEEGISEDVRSEIADHVSAMSEKGNSGKYFIQGLVTGGTRGRVQYQVKKSGEVQYFNDEASAMQESERLNKERNVAGAKAHFSYCPKLVEDENMNSDDKQTLEQWKQKSTTPENTTLGGSFLNRIMEADESSPIKDTVWKGLHSRLKKPYEKKIVELFAAIGIPGRIAIREDGIEDSIQAGAALLRRGGRKQALFNKVVDSFVSGASSAAAVTEAKKRGGRLQKIFETVLVELGLPAVLTTTEGAGALSSVFSRAASKIGADADLETAVIQLAKAMGISSADLNGDMTEGKHSKSHAKKHVKEEVDLGSDAFIMGVMNLCATLGIPDGNMQYQKSVLLNSLRDTRQGLTGRGMIIQRMSALVDLIKKNKVSGTPLPDNTKMESLTEAFGPLEALTDHDLKHLHMMEPANGPAMMANYEGAGAHEETILALGVDPDADDDNKSLRVGIDSPWDGAMHNKFFANNKDGYKAALDYANMLRTANMKTGGRPKGWKP